MLGTTDTFDARLGTMRKDHLDPIELALYTLVLAGRVFAMRGTKVNMVVEILFESLQIERPLQFPCVGLRVSLFIKVALKWSHCYFCAVSNICCEC